MSLNLKLICTLAYQLLQFLFQCSAFSIVLTTDDARPWPEVCAKGLKDVGCDIRGYT